MSRYHVDSFAYDYDMFAPQPKKAENVVELKRKKATSNRSKTAPRSKSSLSVPMTIMVVLILGLISCNIFLRVQITEVTSDISKCDVKLERAMSENTSLEMEIESCISLKNLESSAQQLGMQKAERYQITYIDVVDTDKTEIIKNGTLVTANAE